MNRRRTPQNDSPLRSFWRRRRTEQALLGRQASYRTTRSEGVKQAYEGMEPAEFEAINAMQDWWNRRAIPRWFRYLPDEPLNILDLGCGDGSSTALLARHAPAGSRLLGMDLAGNLLAVARQGRYFTHHGERVDAKFVQGSISEAPFRGPDGEPLPDASIHFAHAAGVIGHHLDATACVTMGRELARVLAPEGCAALDTGPTVKRRALIAAMARAGLQPIAHWPRPAVLPRVQIAFRRADQLGGKNSIAPPGKK